MTEIRIFHVDQRATIGCECCDHRIQHLARIAENDRENVGSAFALKHLIDALNDWVAENA